MTVAMWHTRDMTTTQTVATLEAIINQTKWARIFGIRIDETAPGAVGDTCRPSRLWDNGSATDELLPGTSAMWVTADDVAAKLTGLADYHGAYVTLLGAIDYEQGEDVGEIVMIDAEILAIAPR